jgi:ABC-type nickel/cobalt efflux system permease component RcnA
MTPEKSLDSATLVYLTAASATAGLHALIPDHWLPFVLMGRARGWRVTKTLALASASGALHVLLAIGLGVATYALGRSGAQALAQRAGETLEVLSSGALAIFGFGYGAASWLRERRYHPPAAAGAPASGEADHPGHHHGHLLERWFKGSLTGVSLVVVIGVSPCALAFPILLASAAHLGMAGVLVVAAGFGAATMLTTLLVTLVGSLSARRLDFPFLTRYGDLLSGILIGLVGSSLCLSELLGR